jgi:hypothetical protein
MESPVGDCIVWKDSTNPAEAITNKAARKKNRNLEDFIDPLWIGIMRLP